MIYVLSLILSFSVALESNLDRHIRNLTIKQKEVREKITHLTKDKSCKKNTDCAVLMLGNDGRCGNPTDFWPYSKLHVNNAKLEKIQSSERYFAKELAKALNEKNNTGGVMGICGFASQQAICKKNNCQLDEPGKATTNEPMAQ